jgi:hypothetical protein
LIASVHAGTTLNAVFDLEMYNALLVNGIAIGGTYIRSGFMWTSTVADIRVDYNVRFNFRFGLVPIVHQSKTFC